MSRETVYKEDTPFIYETKFLRFFFSTHSGIMRYSKSIVSNRYSPVYDTIATKLSLEEIPDIIKDINLYFKIERLNPRIETVKGGDVIWQSNSQNGDGQKPACVDFRKLLLALMQ